MQSNFIVIEGLDGSGKSTAIKFIKKYCQRKNLPTVFTREPGGTKIAEDIRNLVLNNYEDELIHSDTELLLMYASRLQHVHRLINPSLKNGFNVVSDRFYLSSLAYQGGGRGIEMKKIIALNEGFLKNCEPDLVIYLDIDPITGLQRANKVGITDRIEKESLDFFNKTRQAFKIFVKDSNKAVEIDAFQPEIIIETRIYEILDNYFSF